MNEIEIAGERLHLLPQRAAYWARERTLFIADIHFGKAAAFRAQGVPVPRGTTAENLAVLDALLDTTQAERIVFLGDFLHAKTSHAPATLGALRAWRSRCAQLDLVLVRGNHDARAGEPPKDLGVRVVDEPFRFGPFALCHHPQTLDGAYVLAGHIHPAYRLHGRGEAVRLPCFWFNHALGVLPAFGSFTGTHTIAPAPGDRIFLVTPDRVLPLRA
ncbi:MAG TPA: ligase-associated DNA damage response endonuclease PdeM [Burkholderiaceae bacterium]|nr:ligase-associated DNA damage response endonuclease PdeM [Burkholderiaceae bacterium]